MPYPVEVNLGDPDLTWAHVDAALHRLVEAQRIARVVKRLDRVQSLAAYRLEGVHRSGTWSTPTFARMHERAALRARLCNKLVDLCAGEVSCD